MNYKRKKDELSSHKECRENKETGQAYILQMTKLINNNISYLLFDSVSIARIDEKIWETIRNVRFWPKVGQIVSK